MRNSLKTSTALIASLSLLASGPAFPQETAPDGEVPMVCADGSGQPCPEGVPLVPAPDAVSPETPPAEEAPAAQSEAPAEAVPVEEAPAEAAPAEEAPAEEAPAEAAPAPEAVTPEPAPEAPPAEADSAPAEAAPVEEAPADAAPVESAPAEAAPVEEAPAEAAPVEEAPVEAAPVEEAPAAAEPTATEPATGEAVPLPEAEVIPENGAATEPGPAPEPGTAETTATSEAGAETAPAADVTAEEAVPVLPVQPDAASGEAPVAAAASTDAAEETPAEGAQVIEEVVTEETARSSSEDFGNTVTQAPTLNATAAAPAAGQTAAQPQKDRGLSDTEKAILLGLGAVAVGAMLSNNRRVELNSGDRVVLERPDGSYQIIKDDNALLRRPGSTVRTERFDDGSTRTTVLREDGSRIVTIRDAEYRVLRRVHVAPDGTRTMLFDDTVEFEPVDVTRLPPPAPVIEVSASDDEEALRAALSRQADFDRSFSLAQVRDIERVRALVPVIDLNAITFETGSAAIRPDQAPALSRLGRLMKSYIDANPREIFLIEGHTDAVGSAVSNLALSDRRAESVALAMTEYFDVPPENMVVQGYGEEFLKVPTQAAERENRRASVRRITDLLRQAQN